jgi:uncharacterized protein (TIGR02594 family)
MIPTKYEFLNNIKPLPKLVATGLVYLGMKEIPGQQSNPEIMRMAKECGVSGIYTNDDMSWCALFICYLCHLNSKPQPFKDYDVLRAASFTKWGMAVTKGDERLGDIAVFTRPGGNHVGIIIAESKDSFHILGGNQSNAVTITEISKYRLSAVRRYYANGLPDSAKKYLIDSSGKLSVNEA